MDLLNNYINEVYQDLNGDGKLDRYDRVGFIKQSDIMVECFAYAAGIQVAPFNEDGVPTLAFTANPDPLIHFWEKMYPVLSNKHTLVNSGDEVSDRTNVSSMNWFKAGEALFITGFLYNTTGASNNDTVGSLRDMEDDFGILPLPKVDESQEKYISVLKDSANIYGLPLTVSEQGRDAALAVLEAAAAEGYNTITPIYYEDALKNKYIRDERSIDIINMMSENPVSDFGAQYIGLDFSNFLRYGIAGKNITSGIKREGKKFQQRLDTMLEGLEGVE